MHFYAIVARVQLELHSYEPFYDLLSHSKPRTTPDSNELGEVLILINFKRLDSRAIVKFLDIALAHSHGENP